ncbi:signal peptidase I [Blastococcus litoris]|uniref:signal peptidase I n=1 Tax=Blastococcus litoris TaxID=2171622 RepID=UPI000E30A8C8|nr:signal peptidase I [Blastococcus litoris]
MTSPSKVASTSALAALVLVTVWLFLPTTLGGSMTYVATHGTSMEPDFHAGDLALLSPADGYDVGDVVAYRSETLDTVVMHRIVSVDAAGFVTQGDNNDWLDEDRPAEEEILGRLFVRIPHGGQVIGAVSSPGVLFSLAGGMLVLLGGLHDPRGRRTAGWLRRRRAGARSARGPARHAHARTRSGFATSTRGRARQVAVGAAGIALVAAVACGVLLALPPTATETRTVDVTQRSDFSYSGTAETGTTYPTGAVETGDTVWNRLVEDLTVTAATSVSGPDLAGVTGTVRLDVLVAAQDGWSAVLSSGPVAAFEGGTASAAVAVDTDAALDLLRRHQEETGSSGGGGTLTVTPVSETTGTVHGRPFTATPPAGLVFALDDAALRPLGTEAADLSPSTATPVEIEEVGPRSLQLLGLSVPIGTARKTAGAALLLSLVALGAGAWVSRTGRGDVSDRFLVRHADRILPVTSFQPGATVIDVSDAESLHRVAERFDTVVLHHAGEEEDTFAVRDVDATYRFVVPVAGDRRRGRPPVPAAQPAESTTVVDGRLRGLWGQVA